MVHINIVCVGKVKEKFFKDAIDEYSKRLQKYCSLSIIEVPDKNLPNKLNDSYISQIVGFESDLILSKLNSSDYNICLDLSGKEYSSCDFAKHLSDLTLTNSSITFVIGGSLGMNANVKNYCNEKLCFSKMTFPHQLIRIFVLEQIFRSFKINNNERYHH